MSASPYLLDTNAYFLFFRPSSPPLLKLTQMLRQGAKTTFYISEITSLEIHSVLGKYRRGAQRQEQQCDRQMMVGATMNTCPNVWFSPKRSRMRPKVYRDMLKLLSDIEGGRGDIQATIRRLNDDCKANAQKLLLKYSDRYAFGAHDALIAGTAIEATRAMAVPLRTVTSDRGLKAVLRNERIPYFDPLTGESFK
jgi:hypothetical protein